MLFFLSQYKKKITNKYKKAKIRINVQRKKKSIIQNIQKTYILRIIIYNSIKMTKL